MASILTFTLNPSVDLFSEVKAVRPIRKMRTQQDRADPGGGGLNVARVVTMLGGAAEAVFLGGGPTGDWLDLLLGKENIPRRMLPIAGQTRVSFSVNEKSSGYDYRFVRGGPDIAADEMMPCLDIARGTRAASWLRAAACRLPRRPTFSHDSPARPTKTDRVSFSTPRARL